MSVKVLERHVKQAEKLAARARANGGLAPLDPDRFWADQEKAAEFIRDFEMAQEKKGLVFSTAGSINNGSRLTGMRLIMAAIQEYGRYT